ncbi:hypothetical protein PILCRDRAFT_16425 [Piloderma croceum F 1598]|uniref:Uncharacterized protein n=1 Tax=Piloderma croceum (strain F 1598) TaxID=765440 RepID=A0A0C3EWK4_PILCF|nr:hypothetical protein PILCRDRAFT_16425 [Piloderma croceum F 1598]
MFLLLRNLVRILLALSLSEVPPAAPKLSFTQSLFSTSWRNMPTSRLIASSSIQARVLYRRGQREKIVSRGVGDIRREVQGGASMVRLDLDSVTEREGKLREPLRYHLYCSSRGGAREIMQSSTSFANFLKLALQPTQSALPRSAHAPSAHSPPQTLFNSCSIVILILLASSASSNPTLKPPPTPTASDPRPPLVSTNSLKNPTSRLIASCLVMTPSKARTSSAWSASENWVP